MGLSQGQVDRPVSYLPTDKVHRAFSYLHVMPGVKGWTEQMESANLPGTSAGTLRKCLDEAGLLVSGQLRTGVVGVLVDAGRVIADFGDLDHPAKCGDTRWIETSKFTRAVTHWCADGSRALWWASGSGSSAEENSVRAALVEMYRALEARPGLLRHVVELVRHQPDGGQIVVGSQWPEVRSYVVSCSPELNAPLRALLPTDDRPGDPWAVVEVRVGPPGSNVTIGADRERTPHWMVEATTNAFTALAPVSVAKCAAARSFPPTVQLAPELQWVLVSLSPEVVRTSAATGLATACGALSAAIDSKAPPRPEPRRVAPPDPPPAPPPAMAPRTIVCVERYIGPGPVSGTTDLEPGCHLL